MADGESQLNWTEDQWATVRRAVLETARKVRVASSFLPLVGPLAPSVTTVPALRMSTPEIKNPAPGEAGLRMSVDDAQVLPLTTISVKVYLRNSEVHDPDLASALSMFSRAAEVIGRVEDSLVFKGIAALPDPPGDDRQAQVALELGVNPRIYTIEGGALGQAGFKGLLMLDADVNPPPADATIVTKVVDAIQALEARGQFGPFACVLGHTLFSDATTPSGSLVLPTDRITPFLEGQQVLRSGTLPHDRGLVLALAADAVELVVATDISVKFLQMTLEPRYVFRVSERIALRIKQDAAVHVLLRS